MADLKLAVNAQRMLEHACRVHTDHAVHRYLMSNAYGRWNGAEKATQHRELVSFYVAVVYGYSDPEVAARNHGEAYKAAHDATTKLTDNLDTEIGFPLQGRPEYESLAPLFFKKFHALAMRALVDERGAARHAER